MVHGIRKGKWLAQGLELEFLWPCPRPSILPWTPAHGRPQEEACAWPVRLEAVPPGLPGPPSLCTCFCAWLSLKFPSVPLSMSLSPQGWGLWSKGTRGQLHAGAGHTLTVTAAGHSAPMPLTPPLLWTRRAQGGRHLLIAATALRWEKY